MPVESGICSMGERPARASLERGDVHGAQLDSSMAWVTYRLSSKPLLACELRRHPDQAPTGRSVKLASRSLRRCLRSGYIGVFLRHALVVIVCYPAKVKKKHKILLATIGS